ncbi:MAG: type IV pilus modification protein PilV [Pseudomonadota bacterium]
MSIHHSPQRGVALLEILIAVLVLSIGILGLAGLQVASLRSNQQTYQRSLVVAMAAELADRMRANRELAATGSYLAAVGTAPATASANCNTAACTPAELASFELNEWYNRARLKLPGSKISVVCSVTPCASGKRQTISIFWDENRTGATDTSCPGPATFNPATHMSCYQLSLTP